MQIMKWLSIATLALLIYSCFQPWVTIESQNIMVTGMKAEAINFGKPGLLHIVLSIIMMMLLLLNKLWSFKTAFFVSAFNIAWSLRNFISISACSAGICPTKHIALYTILITPVAATVFLLLINKEVPVKKNEILTPREV
ncbi:MAG TPA: hypothetical protein VJ499_07710 [Flavisolibacter sp.]|nr:hypothetical protein [Flavisolibacter sp.]